MGNPGKPGHAGARGGVRGDPVPDILFLRRRRRDEPVPASPYTPSLKEVPVLEEYRAGKTGRLVVLDTNPLEDIGNTRGIRAVILGGRTLDREAPSQPLEQGLETTTRPLVPGSCGGSKTG